MKTLFTIILLTIALSVFGQREYTHENKGINVFLEADGSANLDFALGGPALTIGYQFNPHFFFGCGLSNKYGGTRSARPEDTKPLGWYDANDDTFHDDYFIDEKGERHKIIDNPYGDRYTVYVNEDDCEECCDYAEPVLDIYMDVRYNFLAHSRYTPYINLKTGGFFGRHGNSNFDELILGCRFGCGEGDFAIIGGAGWTFRRICTDELKNQHLFTLSLGVEF